MILPSWSHRSLDLNQERKECLAENLSSELRLATINTPWTEPVISGEVRLQKREVADIQCIVATLAHGVRCDGGCIAAGVAVLPLPVFLMLDGYWLGIASRQKAGLN